MIALISVGTVVSALIIEVHKRGLRGEAMSRKSRVFFWVLSKITHTRLPRHIKDALKRKGKSDKNKVRLCRY